MAKVAYTEFVCEKEDVVNTHLRTLLEEAAHTIEDLQAERISLQQDLHKTTADLKSY